MYGSGNASKKIVDIIKHIDFKKINLKKNFMTYRKLVINENTKIVTALKQLGKTVKKFSSYK